MIIYKDMYRTIKREQIIEVFTNIKSLKEKGIWYSGIKGEGKFRQWYKNGQLWAYRIYKNNKRNGEYKEWFESGKLITHRLYKDNDIVKDYLKQ